MKISSLATETGALVIWNGSSIKAMSDREPGWVGGNIITFTDEDAPDLQGDYFTCKSNFDIALPAEISVYFHHGLDKTVGKKALTKGNITQHGGGVSIEAKLDLDDAVHRVIYDKIEEGKLGWSTGAIPWLVERENGAKANFISQWPLKEASITPCPAHPVNTVMAIKSLEETDLLELVLLGSSKLSTLGDSALGAVEIYLERLTAVKSLPERKSLSYAHQNRLYRLKEIAETLMAEVVPIEYSEEVMTEMAKFVAIQARALGVNV